MKAKISARALQLRVVFEREPASGFEETRAVSSQAELSASESQVGPPQL